MERRTHYPNYNVLNEQEHWDDHTREIVQKRLEVPGNFQKLTGEQAEMIRAMAALFVDDSRRELLDAVVKHFDSKLGSDIGEAQRKAGVPPFAQLVKQGLAALDKLAQAEHGCAFAKLRPEQQTALLVGLEHATLSLPETDGMQVPGQPFFQKMLSESVSAYYSHPTVWSEIGYGGPAYPRGYVRSELGLTDPWEARKDA
ncbi:gluconate 2-dehydrogenase subunit 3-like protein [Tumebacillus sp. BK434]|uniref:gluconate 2-dehydrogenase subunit 3 family protein n=1 Tax=Tumebacillus sp. BK434 TaxID=2512169 RepID=UPI0010461EB9|nr:gluconate 2-dehydrogenase subunit 3 family protein [Tumebacillus sp. BK434]TCP58226.1 gluconate 2-dehydrogenase subunit 3-like protein [Tumebacillus sp. BK434]